MVGKAKSRTQTQDLDPRIVAEAASGATSLPRLADLRVVARRAS
jgi:hypothetical protein